MVVVELKKKKNVFRTNFMSITSKVLNQTEIRIKKVGFFIMNFQTKINKFAIQLNKKSKSK